MSNSRNRGVVHVSYQLLAQLLHLPEGHRIVDLRALRADVDAFQMLVEGPSLPSVDYGESSPSVQFNVTVTETGEMVRERKLTGAFVLPGVAPTSDENAA